MASEKNAVRERPILFSGPMVRAILDGRKTQTRRVVSLREGETICALDRGLLSTQSRSMRPYGQPGDRLWVREAWCTVQSGIRYRADFPEGEPNPLTFKPSIHMKREHSRLSLEITEVRVERLQEISAADCIAEGITDLEGNPWSEGPLTPHGENIVRAGYQMLWDSLNAKRGFGWDANPWVWVISFKPADARPSLKEGSEE